MSPYLIHEMPFYCPKNDLYSKNHVTKIEILAVNGEKARRLDISSQLKKKPFADDFPMSSQHENLLFSMDFFRYMVVSSKSCIEMGAFPPETIHFWGTPMTVETPK